MRCWAVTFWGVFIGGHAVVFADDEAAARQRAIEVLGEHARPELREVPIAPGAFEILSDGDY